MEKGFDPIPTAEGWQTSNAPILSMAAHKASLDIFDEAGMDALIEKSKLLTGFLLFLLEEITNSEDHPIRVITPAPEDDHGCQVSILVSKNGKLVFDELLKHGILADWREPDVIRVAPVPLYNTFEEVWQFANVFRKILKG
jgi:kynureninase